MGYERVFVVGSVEGIGGGGRDVGCEGASGREEFGCHLLLEGMDLEEFNSHCERLYSFHSTFQSIETS